MISARECLDRVEQALQDLDYVEANTWLVDFYCQRLNNFYPLADLDARWRELSQRYERELDLGQFLTKAEQYLAEGNHLAAEDTLLAYVAICRQGVRPAELCEQRYNQISSKLIATRP